MALRRGWKWDAVNSRLIVYVDGTAVGYFDNAAPYLTVPSGLTVTAGGATITAGGLTITAGGATITAGGLTITAGGIALNGGSLTLATGLVLTSADTMLVATKAVAQKMTQTAITNSATITAAQLLTLILDGTPTAAADYTLPTAALLVAAIPGAAVGSSFMFTVNNKSAGANTITVVAGAGGTADGTVTVAQNVIRSFLVIITNITGAAEAYFVYGMGA